MKQIIQPRMFTTLIFFPFIKLIFKFNSKFPTISLQFSYFTPMACKYGSINPI